MSRCIYQKCCLDKYLSTMLNLRRLCEVVARGQNFLIKISSQLSFPFLSKLAVVNLTAKLLIMGPETYRVGAYRRRQNLDRIKDRAADRTTDRIADLIADRIADSITNRITDRITEEKKFKKINRL